MSSLNHFRIDKLDVKTEKSKSLFRQLLSRIECIPQIEILGIRKQAKKWVKMELNLPFIKSKYSLHEYKKPEILLNS